jgi:hypothetical protein
MVTGQENSGMFGTELVFGDALAIPRRLSTIVEIDLIASR